MGRAITKDEIGYENSYFWWNLLAYIHGSDDEKEVNLNEALAEAINIKDGLSGFDDWFRKFCPKDEQDSNGISEHPNVIGGNLSDNLSFAIEFHAAEIRYYINDIYIGNIGGEFEAYFFTLDELQAFDKWQYLFLLMLPMLGVEEKQRKDAQQIISTHLREIPLFAECADYAAKCMLNGLIMLPVKTWDIKQKNETVHFYHQEEIGLVNNQNHSVRNVEFYPRYIPDVKKINCALADLWK